MSLDLADGLACPSTIPCQSAGDHGDDGGEMVMIKESDSDIFGESYRHLRVI